MLRLRALTLLPLILACGQPFLNSPPSIRPLSAGDSRQALVGKWVLDLTLDSVQRLLQEPHQVRSVMDSVTPRVVRGTLELRDTIVGVEGTELRSVVSFDFTQLLGHPLSCFTPSLDLTRVERHGNTVAISVTPGAADCGFFGQGRLDGDSIVGWWAEAAFVGHPAAGRLRLVRDTIQ
jgi:hypothetical protein